MNLHSLFLLALQGTRASSPGDDSYSILQIALMIGAAIFLLVFLVVFLRYASLYVQSVTTGAGVGLFQMFAMSLRKVDPATIVAARVMEIGRAHV